jgi:uracil-DNA glycosylase
MAAPLDAETRRQLQARVQYYRDLGIYDFYRRESNTSTATEVAVQPPAAEAEQNFQAEDSLKRKTQSRTAAADPVTGLKNLRDDIGDCRLCRLAKGRTNLVFGTGSPNAEIMFIGEAPGADEDMQGLPFVGRAGQLLTNMINAMGLKREDVYIANIIKCRPPGNRTPERDECETCSPFLMRQIAIIRPKVIVALGAVAAKTLLAINAPMSDLRGRWYEFTPQLPKNAPESGGALEPIKLAVTYHPAFLLRDPRQKKEAWKDLQMVMQYVGLPVPQKSG